MKRWMKLMVALCLIFGVTASAEAYLRNRRFLVVESTTDALAKSGQDCKRAYFDVWYRQFDRHVQGEAFGEDEIIWHFQERTCSTPGNSMGALVREDGGSIINPAGNVVTRSTPTDLVLNFKGALGTYQYALHRITNPIRVSFAAPVRDQDGNIIKNKRVTKSLARGSARLTLSATAGSGTYTGFASFDRMNKHLSRPCVGGCTN